MLFRSLSQSEIIFNKTASLSAARIVDPPFKRKLGLAWRKDSAKRSVLVTIAKLMRSEIQSIVKEGLWGEDINSEIIAKPAMAGATNNGSPTAEL